MDIATHEVRYIRLTAAVEGLGIPVSLLYWAVKRGECEGILLNRKHGWHTTRENVEAWLAKKQRR